MNGQELVFGDTWLYAAACVLFPVVWGLVMVWVTSRVERIISHRRARHEGPEAPSPEPTTLEYHI